MGCPSVPVPAVRHTLALARHPVSIVPLTPPASVPVGTSPNTAADSCQIKPDSIANTALDEIWIGNWPTTVVTPFVVSVSVIIHWSTLHDVNRSGFENPCAQTDAMSRGIEAPDFTGAEKPPR